MMKKKYTGVVVPLITPFTANGNIDEPAVEKLIHFIISNNCYPFILGTTGESLSIPAEFKIVFTNKVIKTVNGKKTVFVGISGMCLKESVEMGKRFADMGADLLVAHLPGYYPLPAHYMLTYFDQLADQLPVPLMIYNIKTTTHMTIPVEVVEKLSHHDNIAGLKDSDRDEIRLDTMLNLFRDRRDFSFFLGWAGKSMYGLINGADGIVPSTANAFPDLYYKLYMAVQEGDLSQAEELQNITNELSDIYQKDKLLSQALPGLKTILEHIDICNAFTLPPCYPLSGTEKGQIISRLNTFKAKKII
ncbi:MAG: hypothetical protein A2Y71_10005 [Bacteroidetes bacterium RBG_13_42_15]|nr:MAG: hypothetical protein A2Y71_10005 [Bacteroidetes bacterium RBG_13_42_15]